MPADEFIIRGISATVEFVRVLLMDINSILSCTNECRCACVRASIPQSTQNVNGCHCPNPSGYGLSICT